MLALRILLIPFSLIYSLIIFIRNKFYDFGIFKAHKVSIPVISIGNVTTGGTGKTPLTIFIAKYFLNKGKKVGIISRGYKRKTSGMVLVSDGKNINENVEQSGDELILISTELIKEYQNNFFIAADIDRIKAADFLITKFNPDLIILDDGFQYRKLKRDLDIVLIDAQNFLSEKFLNTFTLPSGIKRERYSGLSRAGLIIQNNKNDDTKVIPDFKKYGKEILLMRYKTEYLMDSKNRILQNRNTSAIVFSGIARDESFLKMINESDFTIEEYINFPDHHNYTHTDIINLKQKYTEGKIFITTEKDFVKIRQFSEFIENYPVYFLKLGIEFGGTGNNLFSKLDDIIR